MRPASRSMPSAFRRILPEYAIVVHFGVLIQLWRTVTPVAGVQEVRKTLAKFADQIRLTMVIIEDGATQPDREARVELAALGKELAPRFAAVVYEGHGFRAAAVRAVMTSIGLFTRSALPSRVFSSTDAALQWMRGHHPDVPGLDSLDSLLAELRSPPSSPSRSRDLPL